MSLNSATIEVLLAKGLTGDDLLEVARAMEGGSKSPAAIRQKRYRDNQRNERDVTRDVTSPLKEDQIPPSVSDETGGKPPDPVKDLFDLGVSMLTSQGHTEKQARSIIGSWRKDRNVGDVVAALVDAKTKSISNLVEWMPKRLNGAARFAEPIPLYKHLAGQASGASP